MIRIAGLILLLLPVVGSGAGFSAAPFEADVTIPGGHPCMGGGVADAREVVDPLFAKGFVLLGGDRPIVVCALDWCQLNNDAYDRWRDALAGAAGTTRRHVLLATVHQHDAPIVDLRAQRLLDEAGRKDSLCGPAFNDVALRRVADAVRASPPKAQRVTHLGVGQAPVERVASNRRVVDADGRVHWNRTSADRRYAAAPEGEVDPSLKTLSLWDGDAPVLAWSSYAVHPIDLPCLDLADGRAMFLVLPAEAFVGHQLAAQRLRPDSFVIASGFGDGAPGYIPTARCWRDGYVDEYRWVTPTSADLLAEALATVLAKSK